MKVAEEKVRMAYALGGATCEKKGNMESKTIKLKTVNEDWDRYELVGHGYDEKHNNSYDLYYCGDYGSETFYVRIIKICEGWNLNHAIALLIGAIQMHKAEMENKTK